MGHWGWLYRADAAGFGVGSGAGYNGAPAAAGSGVDVQHHGLSHFSLQEQSEHYNSVWVQPFSTVHEPG